MIDYIELLYNTTELIKKYFADKTDLGGSSYLYHLETVYKKMTTDKAKIVALLHDILEDTNCTEEELSSIGCDDQIMEAIKAITRRSDEVNYSEYIIRVGENEIAKTVKIADLENNMDIRRLKSFGDREAKRLKKYFYSWKYLKGDITKEEYLSKF